MFKLIAMQQAGKYAKGAEVTDAMEIADILESPLARRFNKVPLADHETPHAPASAPVAPFDAPSDLGN